MERTRGSSTTADPLRVYNAKRDFAQTPEPRGDVVAATSQATSHPLAFVIQKHDATALHYDVRLELDGVMLSWAVPKGPSLDPADKRLAMRTEDHPLSYNAFEGTIPEGHYGAGNVIVWDRGHWQPAGDPHEGLAAGKVEFDISSEKLAGRWELIRTRGQGDQRERWLLIKKRGPEARTRADYDVTLARPESVASGRELAPRGEPMPTPAAPRPAQQKRIAASKSRARAAMPARLSPQLATLASAIPTSGRWIHEAKLDGYRVLARVRQAPVQLLTRNGKDWSTKMPPLLDEIRALGIDSSWLDGEVVVLVDGVPDFNRLQNAFDANRTNDIIYFVFDAPFLQGEDLRRLPLLERRQRLESVLLARQTDRLRLNVALEGTAQELLAGACRAGLVGIMAKRAESSYVEDRSRDWLKLKCQRRQEFVVGGFTVRTGGRATAADEVGSLLLGYHDERGSLRYAGSVGTGWDSPTAHSLKARLDALSTHESPFAEAVRADTVVEVSFSEWTSDGQLRHPSFQGLRLDKPASEVKRERASDPSPRASFTPTSKRRARS